MVSSKFLNKKYPLIDGKLDFENLIYNFIDKNKKSFREYISIIIQVESRDYMFYTIGERYPIEISCKEDIIDYIDYLRNKWELLDKNSYDPNLAVAIHINWTNIDKTNYLIKQNQIKLENYEQTKDFSILEP